MTAGTGHWNSCHVLFVNSTDHKADKSSLYNFSKLKKNRKWLKVFKIHQTKSSRCFTWLIPSPVCCRASCWVMTPPTRTRTPTTLTSVCLGRSCKTCWGSTASPGSIRASSTLTARWEHAQNTARVCLFCHVNVAFISFVFIWPASPV